MRHMNGGQQPQNAYRGEVSAEFKSLAIARGSLKYFVTGLILTIAQGGLQGAPPLSGDLAQQIIDIMSQSPGVQPGHRPLHAKGIVCQGTFSPSTDAASISRSAHFSAETPVTVRFSDGGTDPMIPDSSPDAAPRGMAIRFMGERQTDIVANSHNGFPVGTSEDFLGLVKAIAATVPSKPHPWPIEVFLGGHPAALKFVQDPKPTPVSFATESFYGNNAFFFVNKQGNKQAGRYQIIPVAGSQHLDDAGAKAKSPDFLRDELKSRIAEGPVKFRLLLQLAEPGDRTNDASVVWPDDRKTLELGVISITSVVPDNAAAESNLAFDPTRLVDGIQLSDDPLPALRSRVYALSVARRRK